MNGYTFTLLVILLAILAGLVYLAAVGSIIAAVVVAILTTVLLVSVGAGIALATQRLANEKSQQDFVNNAKENLAIMGAMQRVQNAQNQTIMSQLRTVARLPEPSGDVIDMDTFISDGVFDELED